MPNLEGYLDANRGHTRGEMDVMLHPVSLVRDLVEFAHVPLASTALPKACGVIVFYALLGVKVLKRSARATMFPC